MAPWGDWHQAQPATATASDSPNAWVLLMALVHVPHGALHARTAPQSTPSLAEPKRHELALERFNGSWPGASVSRVQQFTD